MDQNADTKTMYQKVRQAIRMTAQTATLNQSTLPLGERGFDMNYLGETKEVLMPPTGRLSGVVEST